MARSRNIKASFFINDVVAENDPLGRLLYIGLWTLADFNGNVEWRSKKIKAQLLPYDNCDIDELAINLDRNGLVKFYSDGDKIYLHINNFDKHQNPHKNEREKGSDIPPYSEEYRQAIDLKELVIIRDNIEINHDSSTSNPADSLILIPDSQGKNNSSEQTSCSSPTVAHEFDEIELPLKTGKPFSITNDAYHELCRLYPSVDVTQQLRNMRGWLLGNPSRRKTQRGIMKFINGWMQRSLNQPPTANVVSLRNDLDMDDITWSKNLDEVL